MFSLRCEIFCGVWLSITGFKHICQVSKQFLPMLKLLSDIAPENALSQRPSKETVLILFMFQHDQLLPCGKCAKFFASHQAWLQDDLTVRYTPPQKLFWKLHSLSQTCFWQRLLHTFDIAATLEQLTQRDNGKLCDSPRSSLLHNILWSTTSLN